MEIDCLPDIKQTSRSFMTKTKGLVHEFCENRKKTREKIECNIENKLPRKIKELKSFLVVIQNKVICLLNLLERTDWKIAQKEPTAENGTGTRN